MTPRARDGASPDATVDDACADHGWGSATDAAVTLLLARMALVREVETRLLVALHGIDDDGGGVTPRRDGRAPTREPTPAVSRPDAS